MTRRHRLLRAAVVASVVVGSAACGRKGPPLPPLVLVPAAPADLAAERRGEMVNLRFLVPAANTDGTRPANLQRVDVYGLTGPTEVTEEQVLRFGTRVASLAVKAPRDPEDTIDPDEPASDLEPLEGQGLDQGALAELREPLTPAAMVAVDPADPREPVSVAALAPLLDGYSSLRRHYVAVGITTRGRRGTPSRRAAVGLAPAPPPPRGLEVRYDETAVHLTWSPVAADEADEVPAPSEPASPGPAQPPIAYHVYDAAAERRLTTEPVAEPAFTDQPLAWNVERCYAVRTIRAVGDQPIEGDASPPACITPVDTFPPASPSGVETIPSVGAVNLRWEPSPAADLAGYLVLRGETDDALRPLTPEPIALTTYRDEGLSAGVEYVYAVQAADRSGNLSAASALVRAAAR